MKKLFILFFFLSTLISTKGFAQAGRQVHGIVADSTGVTIPGAVVKLTSPTDSLNVVTNIDGVFTFGSVKAQKFSLTVLSIGFAGTKRSYTFEDGTKAANIGVIKLKAESKMLNAVNITDVNAIKVSVDTTEYKASAYPVRANAPVEDMVKKLPGVDVDASGNVTAEGKSVTKVRINGKDFFGGDVKTATKNLPADVIESIQMIDDYGDQANLTGIKTGEPNKIMNIVIRQDKNYGYSLSGTVGDGRDALPEKPGVTEENRYVGSINSFKFKGEQQIALLGSINNTNTNTFSFSGGGGGGGGFGGGGGGGRGNANRGGGDGTPTPTNGITLARSIGLNFRDQWGKYWSVYGSYSFADNSTNTISTTQQINNSPANATVNNQNSNETDGVLNHRFTWNMEFKPDTINYLKLTPTYSYSSTTTDAFDANSLLRNNSPYSVYTTKTIANSSSPSYGLTFLYNHRFNGHGRNFSLSGSVTNTPSGSFQNPVNVYTVGVPNVPTNQLVNTNTKSNNETTTLSYIEPLSTVSYLEGNYTYNRTLTNTDRENDTVSVSGAQTRYDLLSNNYNFTFVTNRFGLNYRLIEPLYNLTLGGAVQPGVLNGFSPATDTYAALTTHVTTFNIIPTVRFVYNFSRSKSLSVNYNGSSNQPTYSELNPRTDFSNASYPVVGNQFLQPEFNNNFSIRYKNFSFGTGDVFFANASFNQTNNKIVSNLITYPRSYSTNPRLANTQLTEYLNSDGYYSATGFFTYAKPWEQRKYTLIFNGNISYTNNIGYISNVDSLTYAMHTLKNIAKSLQVTPGVRFRVDITDVIDAQLLANYGVTRTNNSISQGAVNSNYQTTNLGINGKNYLWTNWTVSYDYTKTIYQGFLNATNPNIFNAYVERRFLKNNAATIRASAFDIFNQNTGFTQASTATGSTQSLVNRLGRYYLLTFTLRLQKFAGKAPSQDMGDGNGGGRRRRDGGMGGGGGGGGRGNGGGGGGGFGGGPGGPDSSN